jgi:hypothetical protein
MAGKKENDETLSVFVHSFSEQETLSVNDAVCDRERDGGIDFRAKSVC